MVTVILDRLCNHRPLTIKHLSVSWCSVCQDWQVHSSQSGRRDDSGGIVLIEVLQIGNLGARGDDPDQMLWLWQQFLSGCVELEHDRIDTDALL